MVFWVLLGIIGLTLAIGVVVAIYQRDWGYGLGGAAGIAVAEIVVGFVVIAVGVNVAGSSERELESTYGLRALVTEQATETHASATYFLGFGYASSDTSEVTSISYIRTADDGGSTLQKIGVAQAVIYEDAPDSPRVEYWVEVFRHDGSFVPWAYSSAKLDVEHRFHIPPGSILEAYEVTP
jgi:hypothetical protein